MSEPFIGEVKLFSFNFPPQGWAHCDGALLPISQNQALFSLLGVTYGGDGEQNFGLPDLRGRAPIHRGQGPGLSTRTMGQSEGTETTTLTTQNLPAHNHPAVLKAAGTNSDLTMPNNAALGIAREDTYVGNATLDQTMDADSVVTMDTGANAAFNNMPPFLAMNWCIALQGVYPSRP